MKDIMDDYDMNQGNIVITLYPCKELLMVIAGIVNKGIAFYFDSFTHLTSSKIMLTILLET